MTANQMYKNSGSTLTFTEWLNREKQKGVVIPQQGVTDKIDDELQKQLDGEEVNFIKSGEKTVLGLNKTVLVFSVLIVLGAVGYTIYRKRK
jgi:hypothetical protein